MALFVTTPYKKKPVYEQRLAHLVTQISDICEQEKIPFMVTFQTEMEVGPDGGTRPTMTSSANMIDPAVAHPLLVGLFYLLRNQDVLAKIMGGIKSQNIKEDLVDDIHAQADEKFAAKDRALNEPPALS